MASIEAADDHAPQSLAVAFCAIVGSRAYGLASADSDTDRRGFYIPPARLQFSLSGAPEQLVQDQDQVCIWEIEKFFRLALRSNPTALETLFSPLIEFASPQALRVLENREMFLSRLAHQSFMGYADSQFDKMHRARERGGDIKWAHAMHLVRLLHAGTGLMKTGDLDIRVPEALRAELCAIKTGELGWTEVTRMRSELVVAFDDAYESSPLPERPDERRANEILVDIRLAATRGVQGD